MSDEHARRLAKLVKLQNQLKALHENRRAALLAKAGAAGREAEELAAKFDEADSLSALFPEIYHKRISDAVIVRDASLDAAGAEAERLTTATLRARIVEEAHRLASRHADRQSGERDLLDLLDRGGAKPAK